MKDDFAKNFFESVMNPSEMHFDKIFPNLVNLNTNNSSESEFISSSQKKLFQKIAGPKRFLTKKY